ncbi:MAG: metallophosphoesterase family protein [Saprospiraceae bacterium]|nr:metallophosphoesterase family protein [Saprospiraceae bacterium]
MKKKLLVLFYFVYGLKLFAQSLQIQPYLQDMEPNSVVIMWQTDFGEESTVQWGETKALGKESHGVVENINYDDVRLHSVKLEGLQRFTTYFYRVQTGAVGSEIFQFRTPPFASDHHSFSFVAMSDMQKDSDAPQKFWEVANKGVINFFDSRYGSELQDNLAMILIPGDLVGSGEVFEQWQKDFFNPGEKLFSHVPTYPVPGNHERNSVFFFKYFTLPENGTPAHAEHWWYKDYGNLRILGLDSNDGYNDRSVQLTWLESVLEDCAQNSDIDFVFAQLHHPYKSELWIPGEEDFTGEVIHRLESFTDKTGKPSIHFFGHTHGYSRGQSRDHKHLWVNVATAGGSIDNWGEFEGKDYDEFTVTQDEYGFVVVDVNADKDDPHFTLKRISRGNQFKSRENEVTDSLIIWRNSTTPEQPKGLGPSGEEVPLENVVLNASRFRSSKAAAFHAASHWQVSRSRDFDQLLMDSWKQYENWYYNVNQQANDDLTDEIIHRQLLPGEEYYWRVRYRDQYLNWSKWSDIQTFKTKN